MTDDLGLLNLPGADSLVREACAAEGLDPALIARLVRIEQEFAGMARRRGIFDAFDAALAPSPEQPAR